MEQFKDGGRNLVKAVSISGNSDGRSKEEKGGNLKNNARYQKKGKRGGCERLSRRRDRRRRCRGTRGSQLRSKWLGVVV